MAKEISGIPEIVEGTAFYPHILVPNEAFGRLMYEINLAVSDDVFDLFQSQGYIGLHPAGKKKFTPDPVIVFQRFATRKDGNPNPKPKLVDMENNPIDVAIGNGSRVKVMWRHSTYKSGGGGMIQRAELVAVQLVELVEYAQENGGEFDLAAVEF